MVECPQELAWRQGEAKTVALMGTINLAVAELVATIRMLIDTGGWGGHGIRSVEHWVTWKAAVKRSRAQDLVRIARRIDDLPACWALFRAGRVSEDSMVLIARRVPAGRDVEVAGWATGMLVSQLRRSLASCPELPDPAPDKAEPVSLKQRYMHLHDSPDGWVTGEFCLPPSEAPILKAGLQAARDAEFRDRQGLESDADIEGMGGRLAVTNADGLVRMGSEAADALDPTLTRTGYRGERNKVILHHDIDPNGDLGPGQIHLGPVVADTVARYLGCDAEIVLAAYRAGQLLGITPTTRTVPRALRRAIERRDQGCAHPLCTQARWLHIHHIVHWAQRGLTIPPNLVCLCPTHHRELHDGDFTIDGNPEDHTLRFLDGWGRPIEPPSGGPTRPLRLAEPTPYTPPTAERLNPLWFTWN